MSTRIYSACHQAVSEQHGTPPNSFLDQIVDTIDAMPDVVFAKNNLHDIYSVMLGALGPYTGLLHRKAVMCEVLRVQAGFESDWDWNCGVDTTNANSMAHKEGEETGAFQVSWDSMPKDPSLRACVDRHAGAHDVDTFILAMKQNHALAVEYCARLLRFNTTWCGTINDAKKVIAHVRRDAVAEFQTFLSPRPSADAGVPNPSAPGGGASAGTVPDRQFIARLREISADTTALEDAQRRAAEKLLRFDGEEFPHNACAITLSTLLQDAGIQVPDLYQALSLGNHLRKKRGWQVIANGNQQPGDIGSTCEADAHPGRDHIYLVLECFDADRMRIADNQRPEPHDRYVSGKGRTPTKFFLRAV